MIKIKHLNIVIPMISVVLIGTIISIISVYNISQNTALSHPFEAWVYGSGILDFIFPLLSSAPFIWILYFEYKNNYISYVFVRTKKRTYLLKQIGTICLASFLSIFTIYIISLCFSLYFPLDYFFTDRNILADRVLGDMMIHHPFLIGTIYSIFKGFIASLFALFGSIIAIYVNNLFIVLFAPFLYAFIENFVTGILQVAEISIYTSFTVNRLDPNAMTWFTPFYGVLLFIAVIILTVILFRYRESGKNHD